MKQNRSLKELHLPKSFARKEQDSDSTCSPNSICSPKNYLPLHYAPVHAKPQYPLKTTKNTHSHKNLFNFSTLANNSITSPKYQVPLMAQQNNILTPVNRNLTSQEQPKRPRILSKIRTSNTFSEEFKLGRVLGKGRFGNVCMAMHNGTGAVYAAKQISLEKVTPKLVERLIAEIKIQFYLEHENCLKLYKFYKEYKNLYLILEIGESSLFDVLREKKFFTERETAYYIRQTIAALMHLHQHGIIHRDLKP